MRTMMLAALAALMPCAGQGATPAAANSIPVDPDRSVSGTFTAPGTQAWRVYLRAGRYYAVSATETESATVTVRAAGGKSLALFDVGSRWRRGQLPRPLHRALLGRGDVRGGR